jgi:hypothetical protein
LSGFGWGVYIVLQEQFEIDWYFLDSDILLYGQWPVISGTQGPSAGVIRINPSQQITANNPGYVQWQLGPPSAVLAGAAWKLSGDNNYSTADSYTRAVFATNAFEVQFKPVVGWNLPTNQSLTVLPGQITRQTAFYSVVPPNMTNDTARGLGLSGTTNTSYQIQRRASLTSGSWLPVSTNTIQTTGFNLLLPKPATNGSPNFYRAVWLGK